MPGKDGYEVPVVFEEPHRYMEIGEFGLSQPPSHPFRYTFSGPCEERPLPHPPVAPPICACRKPPCWGRLLLSLTAFCLLTLTSFIILYLAGFTFCSRVRITLPNGAIWLETQTGEQYFIIYGITCKVMASQVCHKYGAHLAEWETIQKLERFGECIPKDLPFLQENEDDRFLRTGGSRVSGSSSKLFRWDLSNRTIPLNSEHPGNTLDDFWSAGEPNNYGNVSEDCVSLRISTKRLNDIPCGRDTNPVGFVCQLEHLELRTHIHNHTLAESGDAHSRHLES